jgi:isoleucyl-tRNA synthetase
MIDLHTGVQTALKVHNSGKALQLVHNCVANDLSALYFDCIKDTVCVLPFPLPSPSFTLFFRYCDSRMSPHRLAAQTMLWRALRTLVQSFAPILPHLAEDVFQEAPVLFTHGSTFTHSEQSAKEYGSSVFHYGLQQPALYGENVGRTYSAELASDISESYNMVAGNACSLLAHFVFFNFISHAAFLSAVLPIRARANAAIERARSAGLVGSASEVVLTIKVPWLPADFAFCPSCVASG